ncbi:cation:proton antiporter [Halopseudomonas salegens]|uniref:Transporter, CPA2 family n=1 Tax=Halopseudomonas salegens TaxID=1434072 RepID=A0A1H2G2V1_9GAMM|nr:cation:proton antiporter [Halopseudomonas salegens]SDU13992.1 transporter, CPA2 family [Halopseudomonas salegens]
MTDLTSGLVLLGFIFLVGLAAESLGRHTPIPRVTLLIIAGVALGPSLLGWLNPAGTEWFNVVSQVALTMVGFLLGGHLSRRTLQRHGRDVLALSLAVTIFTAALVFTAVWLVTDDLALALLLGALATATAPAATTDVVRESGAKGSFTDTLLGVVAVDDAWGVLMFSLMMAAASMIDGGSGMAALSHGAWDIGGAVVLGVVLGVPAAFATGRVSPGDPTLAEALGLVFLCLGAARWFEVSFLLAAVVMGAVVANLARHHARPFHAIEHIQWPFMLVFFLLAGAALKLDALAAVGLLGTAYILARVCGRMFGASLGAKWSAMPKGSGPWMGVALLPQAGVAVGMALVAAEQFPDRAAVLLPVVLGATVVFEIIGPPLTRLALQRAKVRS